MRKSKEGEFPSMLRMVRTEKELAGSTTDRGERQSARAAVPHLMLLNHSFPLAHRVGCLRRSFSYFGLQNIGS